MPRQDRIWWRGLADESVARILSEQPGYADANLEEITAWVGMEREGERLVTATRAEVIVHVLYDATAGGGPPIVIPTGTIFTSADTTMRFLSSHEYAIEAGGLLELRLFADYTGEEYNVAAHVIDRIVEPLDLSDLWHAGALLIDQPNAATGGYGASGRLAARQRAMDELALDAAVAERGIVRRPGIVVGREEYPTAGMDTAQRSDFTAAIRAHVDAGGVIQFQDGIGADQVVTGDGTSFVSQPITAWTHNMAQGTSNAVIRSNYRICEVDESCGQDAAAPEPTGMESWAD